MKKIIIIFAIFSVELFACNSEANTNQDSTVEVVDSAKLKSIEAIENTSDEILEDATKLDAAADSILNNL